MRSTMSSESRAAIRWVRERRSAAWKGTTLRTEKHVRDPGSTRPDGTPCFAVPPGSRFSKSACDPRHRRRRAAPAISLDLMPAPSSLAALALEIGLAEAEAGVYEDPPHSNRGPRVDVYQTGRASLGQAWCLRS